MAYAIPLAIIQQLQHWGAAEGGQIKERAAEMERRQAGAGGQGAGSVRAAQWLSSRVSSARMADKGARSLTPVHERTRQVRRVDADRTEMSDRPVFCDRSRWVSCGRVVVARLAMVWPESPGHRPTGPARQQHHHN